MFKILLATVLVTLASVETRSNPAWNSTDYPTKNYTDHTTPQWTGTPTVSVPSGNNTEHPTTSWH